MKTIGIIGGVGPHATVDIEAKILKAVDANVDQDNPIIITINDPNVPDRTKALLGTGKSPVASIVRTGKKLVSVGADILCIPCNTAHAFFDEFCDELPGVEFVNMVDEVAAHTKQLLPNVRRVGVLCTDGTRFAKLYDKSFALLGVGVVYPSFELQKSSVMESIYGDKGIKAGGREAPRRLLLKAVQDLEAAGAEAIILGCTELPLVLKHAAVPLIDANDVLATVMLARAKAPVLKRELKRALA